MQYLNNNNKCASANHTNPITFFNNKTDWRTFVFYNGIDQFRWKKNKNVIGRNSMVIGICWHILVAPVPKNEISMKLGIT